MSTDPLHVLELAAYRDYCASVYDAEQIYFKASIADPAGSLRALNAAVDAAYAIYEGKVYS